MEKLIELLNEYDSGWSYDDYYGPFQYGQDSDAYHLCKYQLVSKEYGFIKWLVENDKIDFRKLDYENIYMSDYGSSDDIFLAYNKGEQGIIYIVDYYESLLMLLAIQDEPIEFLCSLLK